MNTYQTGWRPLPTIKAVSKRIGIAALLVLWGTLAIAVPPPSGVAPVLVPAGGFAIEGDILANTPATGVGDWVAVTNFAGAGAGVLDANGTPLNPATTFHFVDLYNTTADNTFAGGLKWTDDPNTWQWTTSKAGSKVDINNVLVHFATDANAHTWVIIAADRFSTSGDSYIDFEFLQNTLTCNANGTFSSAGPNGGRTTNDVLLSLAFTSGGSVADFFAWRWLSTNGGFAYFDYTAALPVGGVFVAANSNTVAVPFGAFGTTNYAPNAFVEAALDLTALLGNFDPCLSLGVKTLMVKTKTSASSTATISDFINPIQYTLKLGPSAYAGPPQSQCYGGATTAFPLNGQATPGIQPIASTYWSVISGTATIDNTNALNTTAYVSSPTATLRLTVIEANGCTETSDVVLTVSPLPTAAISGASTVCPQSSSQFAGPAGMSRYAWSVSGNGTIVGATNSQTITVTAGPCGTNFTVALTVTSNQCPGSATMDVQVTDTQSPTITAPPDRTLECPANTSTNVNGVATVQDNCPNVALTYSDSVSNSCGGAKVILRTWTATDLCGNSASAVQTITVRDTTPPTITAPANRTLECPANTNPANTGTATAQDGCSSVVVTYSDVTTNGCGGAYGILRTWTATDACGNAASALQIITVRDTTAPTITAPPSVVLECPADTSTNSTGVATATDTCSSVTISYSDVTTNGCGGSYGIVRTWTATDGCGNRASAAQVIKVRDITPPTITAPADLVLECPANTSTNNTGVATAQDGCSSVTIRYSDIVSNACGGSKLILRTWTATDACGNSASALQRITVQDTTPPIVTPPQDLVLQCPANTSTNNTGVATAQDGCSSVTIAYSDTVSNTCGGSKIISRTWTATDACGNNSSAVQTITVEDISPPTITAPANVVLDCPADTSTNHTGVATAQDTCSAVTISYSDLVTNGCGGTKVIARTWIGTDGCGNRVSAVQTITVRDITPPTITAPASLVLECPANTTTNACGVATATDGCSSVAITYSDVVSNSCGGAKRIARTWTATDACGNTASALQTITVRDTTAPTITAPASLVLECPANTSTNACGVATATDGCSSVSITYSDVVSNSCGGSKVIARTWTATDACGNQASAVQTLTIRDTTPPIVTPPANLVLECPANTTTNATGVATAIDGCSSVSITYSDVVSNSCGGSKTIVRTWTATDACGNSSSAPQTITIRDTTAPTITAPPSLVLECPANTTTNATGVATATDGCSAVTITYSDVVSNSCGGSKVIARTWLATDGCGNSVSALQTITVRDTTPPTITAPANLTLECPAITTTNATGVATATDGCSSVSITYTDIVSNGCGGSKVIARTWTATDACGNLASAVQTITVRDTTPPTITAPANLVLECPANTTTNATGVARATDGCSSVSITYSDVVSNSCGGSKTIARTWTATDACGNSASAVQTITVRDTIPPTVTPPPNLTLECPANTTTNATGVATATDGCSSVSISYSDVVSNSCGGSKTIIRTWTATDACGNTASAPQTITVRDTTAPTITAPPSVVLECPADTSTNANGVATAQDGCSAVTITYSDVVSNSCGGSKTILRTWTATDGCGNHVSALQTLTVRDTTPPTITAPPSLVLECTASTSTNSTGMAAAQDGCSSVTIRYSDSVSNICGGSRLITRTWTATDACGNSASAIQTLTMRDTTPPSLVLPANVVQECPGNTNTSVTGVPTAVDACGSVTLTYSDTVSNSCGLTKTVWRLWTATDQCGNSTNGTQTIVIRDTTAPRITCPSIAVQCTDDVPAPYANLGAFLAAGGTASDACSPTLTFALVSDSGLVGSCPGTVTRVYQVTDACGNSANGTQTIVVDDTTPPVLVCPTNMTVECSQSIDPSTTGRPTATDNCSTNIAISYADAALGSQYNVKFYAADPGTNTGPYSPTYLKFAPGSLPCPPEAALTGRAADPLRNAVAYGPTGSTLDALMTLNGGAMNLGQIVPFEVEIDASGAPGPERGTIDFTSTWSTYTTSNERFGFDTNYMVYCAFVDYADPGTIDPNFNARVESYNAVVINPGTIAEAIQGTFRVSGLDPGDRVIVEIWVVLDPTAPKGGGTVAAGLVSAQADTVPPTPISTGVQTTGIGNLNKLNPLPAPVAQPPLGPLPPQPPVPPGATVSVFNRTWTATDVCSNRSTCVQQITIRDTTPPGLTLPPDVALSCPADTSTNNTGSAIALDACGSSSLTYRDTVTNGCGGAKVISRLWTAVDWAGNTTNAMQTITVTNPVPSLTVPADLALECPADTRTNVTGVATALDACNSVTITYNDVVSPGCGGAKVIARTWTATDACGTTSSAVQTITVHDTTPPTITAPASVVLECPADTGTNATGVALAQDGCSAVSISYADTISNSCGGSKVITRTWTATDACGNTASAVQTITVRDTTPPTVTAPPSIVLECPADTRTNVTGVATAQDGCSSVTISYTDVITSGCAGTNIITRTWTAIDACGNTASAVQTITVRDTTPPTVTAPPSVVLECPADTRTNVTGVATAQDGCSSVTISYADVITSGCAGTNIITRTWTATDACGNTASAVQTVTIHDTTAPTITAPANLVLQCSADTSTNSTGVATAQDTCSTATVTYSDSISNTCGAGKIITRTWLATDTCGNSASAVQTITVTDTNAPTITVALLNTGTADDYSTNAYFSGILQTNFSTVFTNGLTIGVASPTNSTGAPYSLTYESTDLAALQAMLAVSSSLNSPLSPTTATLTGTIGGELARQTIALALNIGFNSAGILGAAPNNFGALVYTNPGDTLSGSTVAEILQAANNALAGLPLPAEYNVDRLTTLIANLNFAFRDYSVSSFAAGDLSAPQLLLQCSGQVPLASALRVVASDTCSSVTVTSLPDVVTNYTCPAHYTLIRSWVAQDACGNTSTASIQIVVNDTTPPLLQAAPDKQVVAGSAWSFDDPIATDNCGAVTLEVLGTTTNIVAPNTIITRTWQATDACGNSSTCQQTVTVAPPPTAPAIIGQPQSEVAGYGTDLMLTVSTTGSGPMTYQWQLNGVNIAGATGSSLNISGAQFANAGLYTVVISNVAGSVVSQPAIVNVAPVLTSQLVGRTVTLTWPGPFILQAASTPAGPYTDVPGAVSPYVPTGNAAQQFFRLRAPTPTLTVTNLGSGGRSLTLTGLPGFNIVVQASTNLTDWINIYTNTAPCTFVDPNAAQYPVRYYRTVLLPLSSAPFTGNGPQIAIQPKGQTLAFGSDLGLSVTAASTASLTYQWYFNGTPIAGATASALHVPNVQFGSAGLYSVTLENPIGAISSQPAVVNVMPELASQSAPGGLKLSWPGPFILQSATQPAGPFQDVNGAASPYTWSAGGAPQKFFRLRSQPYDVTITRTASSTSLQLIGPPGCNFIIQASTNLFDWVNLQTNTAPANYLDPNSNAMTARYYRAVPAR